MASNFSQAELSALLGAAAPSPASLLLGGSQSLAGLNNGGAAASGDNLASAAAAAARNSNLLNTLLLQRQAEEQQKLQMAQQLAALSGLSNPLPQVDNLALWLQQQQQLQKLQALAAQAGLQPSSAAATNARLFGLGGAGLGGIGGLAGLGDFSSLGGAAPTNLDLLSKLLPPSVTTPTAATTTLSTSLLQDTPGLPVFPDRKRKGRTGTFPQKLHTMLSDLEGQEGGTAIASFLPHGRAFAIHKPRDFVKHVMPKYFRMSRFSSFQRQLNLYDFQRITEGPDKGAYFHELFVQGRVVLSTMMKRNKIKGVKNQQQQQQQQANNDSNAKQPESDDNREDDQSNASSDGDDE